MIELECKPFDEWTEAPDDGILITNPPYGERINPTDIAGLYKSIGHTLKFVFKGYHAWILGYKDEHFKEIGLKPSVKFPILNGSLECELREYVLFDGKYDEFKIAGGSVQNKTFNRDAKPKVRRMTDEEWTRETRKFNSKASRRDDKKDKRYDDKKFKKDFKSDKPYDRKRNDKFDEPKREWKKDARSIHNSRKEIEIVNKAPKLSADSETIVNKVYMRSRKAWKKQKDSEDN